MSAGYPGPHGQYPQILTKVKSPSYDEPFTLVELIDKSWHLFEAELGRLRDLMPYGVWEQTPIVCLGIRALKRGLCVLSLNEI